MSELDKLIGDAFSFQAPNVNADPMRMMIDLDRQRRQAEAEQAKIQRQQELLDQQNRVRTSLFQDASNFNQLVRDDVSALASAGIPFDRKVVEGIAKKRYSDLSAGFKAIKDVEGGMAFQKSVNPIVSAAMIEAELAKVNKEQQEATKQAAAENAPPGFLRGATEVAASLGQGLAGVAGGVARLVGADTAGDWADAAVDALQSTKTKFTQDESKELSEAIRRAELGGSKKEEILAYLNMAATQPLDTAAQALASFLPFTGAAKVASITGKLAGARTAATAAGRTGARLATGAGLGAGEVAGNQYEQTYSAAKQAGMDDATAKTLAQRAVSEGRGSQAIGAGLGVVGALLGPAERVFSGAARPVVGNVAGRTLAGIGLESGEEAGQEGFGRYAGNIGAIGQGVMSPDQAMQGVVGSAALGGVVGGAIGGVTANMDGRPQVDDETAPPPTVDAPPPPFVIPESPSDRASARREILNGNVPPQVQQYATDNGIEVDQALDIYKQQIGSGVPAGEGLKLKPKATESSKFFTTAGVDGLVNAAPEVEIAIGDSPLPLTGQELIAEIKRNLDVVNALITQGIGGWDAEGITEISESIKFLNEVQKQFRDAGYKPSSDKYKAVQNATKLAQATQAAQAATAPAQTAQATTAAAPPAEQPPPQVTAQAEQAPATQPTVQPVATPVQQPIEEAQDAVQDQGQEAAQEVTTPIEQLAGRVVDYNGNVGILRRSNNGYFVNDQIIESGLSGRSAEELGVSLLPEQREEAFVAGQSLGRIAPELATSQEPQMTDLDLERDVLLEEFEALIGAEETDRLIDIALATLGGGTNFERQLNAVKGALYGYLEQATAPTGTVGQNGGTATQGGAAEVATVAGVGAGQAQPARTSQEPAPAAPVEAAPEQAPNELMPSEFAEDIAELESQIDAITIAINSAPPSKSLASLLKGKLTASDVKEIFSTNIVGRLYLGKGGRGSSIADLTANGSLDDFLPPEYRSGVIDENSFQEAEEYIKDAMRSGNYLTYDAKQELSQLGMVLSELDSQLRQLKGAESANSELEIAAEEARIAEQESRVFDPIDEGAGTGVVNDEQAGRPEQPARRVEEPSPPVSESAAAPAVAAPSRAEVEAKQEREASAAELDQREQVRRESEVGAGQFELGREDGRVDDTGNLFSQTNAPITGNTVAEVQAALKAAGLSRNKIKVVQSLADADAGLESFEVNGVQGFYDPKTGEITLIADYIPKGNEAGVALHEIVHRAATIDFEAEQQANLVNQVNEWASAPEGSAERAIFDAANRRASRSGQYDKEFLAYAVEEARNQGVKHNGAKSIKTAEGWLARVLTAFRNLINKLVPGYGSKLTADQLVDIAYGIAARDAYRQGGPMGGGGGEDIQFSAAEVKPSKFNVPTISADQARNAGVRVLDAAARYGYRVTGLAEDSVLAKQLFKDDGKNLLEEIYLLQSRKEGSLKKNLKELHDDMKDKGITGFLLARNITPEGADVMIDLKHQQYNVLKDPQTKEHKELRDRYLALSPVEKTAIKFFQSKHSTAYDRLVDAMATNLRDAGVLEKDVAKEITALRKNKREGYLSEMRMGKYVVTAYAKNKDGKQGDVVGMSRSDSVNEIEEMRQRMIEAFPDAIVTNRQEFQTYQRPPLNASKEELLAKYENQLKRKGRSQEEIDTAVKDMADVMASFVLNVTDAKLKKKAKGVFGANRDMMQAQIVGLTTTESMIANMEYTTKINKAIAAAEAHIKKNEVTKPGQKPYDGVSAANALSAMKESVRYRPPQGPMQEFANAANVFGYLTTMAGNISSGFVNLFSLTNVALPDMVARHGSGAALTLTNAIKDAALYTGRKDLPPEIQDIVNVLQKYNRNTFSEAAEVMDISRGRSQTAANVMDLLSLPMTYAENLTNIAIALAESRLTKETDPEARERAIVRAVDAGNFNNAATTKGVYMKTPVGRIAGQLKSYSINMTARLYADTVATFSATTTPQEKAEAFKRLTGTVAAHGLMAGALGLPFALQAGFAAALTALAYATDDEELQEADGIENKMRIAVSRAFGTENASSIIYGIGGAGLSQRIGLNDLLIRTSESADRSPAMQFILSLLGPSVTNSERTYKAVTKLFDDLSVMSPERAMQEFGKSMPLPMFANAFKGYDQLQSGKAVAKTGETLAEVEQWEAIFQSMGFRPSGVAEAQNARSAIQRSVRSKDAEKRLVSGFYKQMAIGQINGMVDNDDVQAAIDAVESWNSKNPKDQINMDRLRKSAEEKAGSFIIDLTERQQEIAEEEVPWAFLFQEEEQ